MSTEGQAPPRHTSVHAPNAVPAPSATRNVAVRSTPRTSRGGRFRNRRTEDRLRATAQSGGTALEGDRRSISPASFWFALLRQPVRVTAAVKATRIIPLQARFVAPSGGCICTQGARAGGAA